MIDLLEYLFIQNFDAIIICCVILISAFIIRNSILKALSAQYHNSPPRKEVQTHFTATKKEDEAETQMSDEAESIGKQLLKSARGERT